MIILYLQTFKVKYVLKRLEDIIGVLLKPRNIMKEAYPLEFIERHYDKVEAEIERVKQQLLLDSFNCEQDSRLCLYIKQHQYAVVALSDQVFDFLKKKVADHCSLFPSTNKVDACYTGIQLLIDNLLQFLRTNFNRFIDNDGKLDDYRKHHYASHLGKFMKSAVDNLQHHKIDKELVDIMIHPFKAYCKEAAVSFARHDFTKKLEQLIVGLKERSTVDNAVVCHLLIELNYNTVAFREYYINYLKEGSRDADSPEAFYYLQIKKINQLPVGASPGFENTRPPIRELICTWLNEELIFMEKQQQMAGVISGIPAEMSFSGKKVQTTLPVSHLSLAVRLLLDTGVIRSRNTTDILRLVSRSFSTGEREDISEGSLRNKVYNVESAAVKGVKSLIADLLNEVRKY